MENRVTGPGYYKARPVSWKADVNKNNKPFANVKFDNGLYWRGWLTGNAIQYTVDALHLMGFSGRSPNDLNIDDNALDKNREVDISIDWMKNADGAVYEKDGKAQLEVAGVWPPYEKKSLDPQNVKTLEGMDLRAYLKESQKTMPVVENLKKAQEQWKPDQFSSNQINTDQMFTSDDIPF